MPLSYTQIWNAAGQGANLARLKVALYAAAVTILEDGTSTQPRRDLASRCFLDMDHYATRFMFTLLASVSIAASSTDVELKAACLAQWDVHTNPTSTMLK